MALYFSFNTVEWPMGIDAHVLVFWNKTHFKQSPFRRIVCLDTETKKSVLYISTIDEIIVLFKEWNKFCICFGKMLPSYLGLASAFH